MKNIGIKNQICGLGYSNSKKNILKSKKKYKKKKILEKRENMCNLPCSHAYSYRRLLSLINKHKYNCPKCNKGIPVNSILYTISKMYKKE